MPTMKTASPSQRSRLRIVYLPRKSARPNCRMLPGALQSFFWKNLRSLPARRILMATLSRRDFLGQSATAVGVLAAANALAPAAQPPLKPKSAPDQGTLGRTGIKPALLG